MAVEREAVVVIEMICRAGIDSSRAPALPRQLVELAVAVEQERAAIPRPVRCLDVVSRDVDRLALAALDIQDLEAALQRALRGQHAAGIGEAQLREHGRGRT